jgi:hypothetical protein
MLYDPMLRAVTLNHCREPSPAPNALPLLTRRAARDRLGHGRSLDGKCVRPNAFDAGRAPHSARGRSVVRRNCLAAARWRA